jgi:hypothetical protein
MTALAKSSEAKMQRTFLVVVALVLVANPAVASKTFDYSCDVGGKSSHLQVNPSKNLLLRRGKKYTITRSIRGDDDNAERGKAGWHAVGNGTELTVCVATRGVANIDQPGQDNVVCDQFPSQR